MGQLFSVKQAATKLGCSTGLVYALCAAGKLRHSRIGLGRGKIVIPEEALAEYLAAGESGPEPVTAPPAARQKVKFVHLNLS